MTSALTALFAASIVRSLLMTDCTDGSYRWHIQQSHDLSSSDVDPCELPDSLLVQATMDFTFFPKFLFSSYPNKVKSITISLWASDSYGK